MQKLLCRGLCEGSLPTKALTPVRFRPGRPMIVWTSADGTRPSPSSLPQAGGSLTPLPGESWRQAYIRIMYDVSRLEMSSTGESKSAPPSPLDLPMDRHPSRRTPSISMSPSIRPSLQACQDTSALSMESIGRTHHPLDCHWSAILHHRIDKRELGVEAMRELPQACLEWTTPAIPTSHL